ncbi:sugar 3,4-ketoisomerase [Paraburkholderia sp. A1RO-1]|uniref:sugar 3,4-ketoisomerase n=1 Tax=Paraburkholderia sp. A1RO-1 TaxID=3028368 RepID=UPI003B764DFD
MASVHNCRILRFPQIHSSAGTLTPIENMHHVPFEIQRVYYLYDISAGASRAGHSHKNLQQVLIAMSGSFDVHLDDGREKRVVHLSQPHEGLYIPTMIWREIHDFSSGAVCVALASLLYDEGDYYRRYDDFLRAASEQT